MRSSKLQLRFLTAAIATHAAVAAFVGARVGRDLVASPPTSAGPDPWIVTLALSAVGLLVAASRTLSIALVPVCPEAGPKPGLYRTVQGAHTVLVEVIYDPDGTPEQRPPRPETLRAYRASVVRRPAAARLLLGYTAVATWVTASASFALVRSGQTVAVADWPVVLLSQLAVAACIATVVLLSVRSHRRRHQQAATRLLAAEKIRSANVYLTALEDMAAVVGITTHDRPKDDLESVLRAASDLTVQLNALTAEVPMLSRHQTFQDALSRVEHARRVTQQVLHDQ